MSISMTEAIQQALHPITVDDMIRFMSTPFNEDEESTAKAVRYFRNLAESKDPKAARYIQNFILSST